MNTLENFKQNKHKTFFYNCPSCLNTRWNDLISKYHCKKCNLSINYYSRENYQSISIYKTLDNLSLLTWYASSTPYNELLCDYTDNEHSRTIELPIVRFNINMNDLEKLLLLA